LRRLLALLAVALAAGCGGDEPEPVDLLVTADRVFDGRAVIEHGGVAFAGDAVVAVGAASDLDVEPKRTISLGDATVVPGVIDLHVHGFGEGQIGSPVTTVRDVGAPLTALPPSERARAPRVVASAPFLAPPGGYPMPVHGDEIGLVVQGAEEARQAVDLLVDRGASLIKVGLTPANVFPNLSEPELTAIVDQAHEHGIPVTAHVDDAYGVRRALAAGVDDLAHMPHDAVAAALLREVADAGVEIVGTLHVEGGAETAALANARAFVAAGGTLLYGSDYLNPGIAPGLDLEELELMAAAGLTPRQVLTNATSRAADQLGRDDIGALEIGASADLFAVRGDPLRGLGALRDTVLVVVRGDLVVDGPRLNLPGG
jgi:imidazolonepropionase-like amidohydrolase